jgi:hypothetical protein
METYLTIGPVLVFRTFPLIAALAGKMHVEPRKLSTKLSRGAIVRLSSGLLAFLTCLAFSGCVVLGPPPVEIKAEREGKFCPPGQAKKGNC